MKMYFRATATQFGAGRGRNITHTHTHTHTGEPLSAAAMTVLFLL